MPSSRSGDAGKSTSKTKTGVKVKKASGGGGSREVGRQLKGHATSPPTRRKTADVAVGPDEPFKERDEKREAIEIVEDTFMDDVTCSLCRTFPRIW